MRNPKPATEGIALKLPRLSEKSTTNETSPKTSNSKLRQIIVHEVPPSFSRRTSRNRAN